MRFVDIFKRRPGPRSGAESLRQACQASLRLMRHVGLSGRCDCVQMRDAEGGGGLLLQIETPLRIPVCDREDFQLYFARKLEQFGLLAGQPLVVLIRDGDDMRHASRPRGTVRANRIASVIAAANEMDERPPAEQLALMRDSVRERTYARREARGEPVGYAPMTDLGSLPSA